MENFKNFITEAKRTPEETKTRELIREWRTLFKKSENRSFGDVKFYPDGSIDFLSENLKIEDFMLEDGKLKIKVNECKSLTIYASQIASFENFPATVLGKSRQSNFTPIWLLASNAPLHQITFPEHYPRHVNGIIDFSNFKKMSLSHLDKYIDYCPTLIVPRKYKGPILSLLKINGLKKVSMDLEQIPISEIVKKHLSRNRDILECQTELIEAGFKEYAKL
jgi:hypothetical protein